MRPEFGAAGSPLHALRMWRFRTEAFCMASIGVLKRSSRSLWPRRRAAVLRDARRKSGGALPDVRPPGARIADPFFPKLDEKVNLIAFSEIAERYLHHLGYEPVQCATEDEARAKVVELKPQRKWPVDLFASDTTGRRISKSSIPIERLSIWSVLKASA